jgi:hypothetical protein
MSKKTEELLKRKIRYLKTLLKITKDERDWYADFSDELADNASKDKIEELDNIQLRYNLLGKEPR